MHRLYMALKAAKRNPTEDEHNFVNGTLALDKEVTHVMFQRLDAMDQSLWDAFAHQMAKGAVCAYCLSEIMIDSVFRNYGIKPSLNGYSQSGLLLVTSPSKRWNVPSFRSSWSMSITWQSITFTSHHALL